MIWTDADREAFVRRGPKLWEAVPETKPAFGMEAVCAAQAGREQAFERPDTDDLAAAFGLAVRWMARREPYEHCRVEQQVAGDWVVTTNHGYTTACADGLLVAAYRALYAVHGLEWEEVDDATR